MWNIYNFKTPEEGKKVFAWVHNILKYKFVVPLINQLGRIIDRNVNYTKKYDNHSKIYFAFDKALKEAEKDVKRSPAFVHLFSRYALQVKHLRKVFSGK